MNIPHAAGEDAVPCMSTAVLLDEPLREKPWRLQRWSRTSVTRQGEQESEGERKREREKERERKRKRESVGDQLADAHIDNHTELPAAVSSSAAAAPTVASLMVRPIVALRKKSLLPLNDQWSDFHKIRPETSSFKERHQTEQPNVIYDFYIRENFIFRINLFSVTRCRVLKLPP